MNTDDYLLSALVGFVVHNRHSVVTAQDRGVSQASATMQTCTLTCTAVLQTSNSILQTSTAIHQLCYSQLALVAGAPVPNPSPLGLGGGGRLGRWVTAGMGVGFRVGLICSGLPVS